MAKNSTRISELRRKYKNEGFASLSEREIMELILSYAKTDDFENKADEVLRKYGSVSDVINADISELRNDLKLNDRVIMLLRFIPCFSKLYMQGTAGINSLESSEKAKSFFENFFIGFKSEKFGIACTSDNFSIVAEDTMSLGMNTKVQVSIREIVDFTLRNGSNHIFISHTHITGSSKPSANDIAITDYIYDALKPFGIILVDHIIVAQDSSLSMREFPLGMKFKREKISGYITNAK